MGMLEQIRHVKPEDPPGGDVPWEGLEDMPFTKAIRSELVTGAGA